MFKKLMSSTLVAALFISVISPAAAANIQGTTKSVYQLSENSYVELITHESRAHDNRNTFEQRRYENNELAVVVSGEDFGETLSVQEYKDGVIVKDYTVVISDYITVIEDTSDYTPMPLAVEEQAGTIYYNKSIVPNSEEWMKVFYNVDFDTKAFTVDFPGGTAKDVIVTAITGPRMVAKVSNRFLHQYGWIFCRCLSGWLLSCDLFCQGI